MPETTPSENSNRHTVPVELAERSYPIHIGPSQLAALPDYLADILPACRHAVLISDANVGGFTRKVEASLEGAGFRLTCQQVASGEASKSLAEAERLWQAMLADRTDRGSIVIALGGGVIGDLAGFVAASYARGIPLVQLPTTLLSQVDSSVGGKTAVNLPGAKNIVGAFWQPSLVAIDTDTLHTLPRREYVSGLAEVAKYGVILLPELFAFLEANSAAVLDKDPEVLTHIIRESCRAKAVVVQEDERETSGRRAILNYGHTFAHAIESVGGYGTLLHGEAVSIGMQMAAALACSMGRVDREFVERQSLLLRQLELPVSWDATSGDKLWDIMLNDKKVEHGKLRFILPSTLGHVELVSEVPRDLAEHAIRSCLS